MKGHLEAWRMAALPRWIVQVVRRERLRRRFGFDAWHVRATPAARPYKQVAAGMIESLPVSSVADVGCGLGDLRWLLSDRLSYVGLDVREDVLAAARYVHRHRVNTGFVLGSFADVGSLSPDVVVALNWIDGLPPERLRDDIERAASRSAFVLIDVVPGKEAGFDHGGLVVDGFSIARVVTAQDDKRLDRELVLYERRP